MLVLTRTINESVMIGDDFVVTVLDVRGDQVRLGIQAPRHVDVHREEVYLLLKSANRSAASPTPEALGALEEIKGTTDQPPAEV